MAHSVLGKRQTLPPPSLLELVEQACQLGPCQSFSEIRQIQQALKSSDRMKLLKQQTDNFRTPLLIAADAGREDLVIILLEAGAPVDGRECLIYRTPLQQAASKGHSAVVALLLAKGADPRAEVWRNVKTLDLAQRSGDPMTIALLHRALTQNQPNLGSFNSPNP